MNSDGARGEGGGGGVRGERGISKAQKKQRWIEQGMKMLDFDCVVSFNLNLNLLICHQSQDILRNGLPATTNPLSHPSCLASNFFPISSTFPPFKETHRPVSSLYHLLFKPNLSSTCPLLSMSKVLNIHTH